MDKSSDSLIKSVKEKLDEKNRKQILKLKYYCKNNNINIPSHQIYLAVMEHSINTVNDLKNNLDKIKKL
jgi:hypothetical protein